MQSNAGTLQEPYPSNPTVRHEDVTLQSPQPAGVAFDLPRQALQSRHFAYLNWWFLKIWVPEYFAIPQGYGKCNT